MPSLSIDFTNQVKKMSSDIEISLNPADDQYSVNIQNQYKRQLTIDLTGGKSATDLVCLVFDHYALTNARKSALNFCDLRVTSMDGSLSYGHYVQSYNTRYCCVFVKFPTALATNTTTNILITYGNPALKSQSDYNVVSPKLNSNDLIYAIRSNECEARANYIGPATGFMVGGVFTFSTPIHTIENHALDNRIGWKDPRPNTKTYSRLQLDAPLNTIPIIRFDGTTTTPETYSNSKIGKKFKTGFSSFVVTKADTLANYNRIVGFDGGGVFHLPVYWNPALSALVSVMGVDGGTGGGLSTGAVAGAWNILTTRWSKNTTGGFNTFRNSLAIGSRNSINVDLDNADLWLASRFDTSEYATADLAETLVFNSYLNDVDRLDIERYLNIKYRIEASLLPVLTLGSEQSVAITRERQSYAPFASWDSKSEMKQDTHGVAGATATANLLTMMSKTIASGSSVENWSLSSVDSSKRIPSEYARTRTASTVGTNDVVDIYTSLDNYTYQNIVTGGTAYPSDTDDFTEFDFFCTTASLIDTTNSYIEFSNVSGSIAKRGLFSFNSNGLVDGLNLIKIKKSQFLFGGAWTEVSKKLAVRVVTISGTQEVLYNNFRLTQNLGENDYYKIQNNLTLNNAVSSDNDASYYNLPVITGRITGQELQEEDIKFKVEDYLEIVRNKTFGELESFKGFEYFRWFSSLELPFLNRREIYVTFCLERIFNLILPDYYWQALNTNFVAITPATGNTFNIPNKNEAFIIYKNDKVGDVLDTLLKPIFGAIYYRPNLGKFECQGGNNILAFSLATGSILANQVLEDRLIYNYKTVTGQDSNIINQFNFANYQPFSIRYNETLAQFVASTDLEVPPNTTTQFFFNLTDFDQTLGRKLLGSIRVFQCLLTTVQGQDTIDNAGIEIKSCRPLTNDTWVLDIVSTSGITKWIRTLRFTADFAERKQQFYDPTTIFNKKLIYDNPNISIKDSIVLLKNQSSITKYGVKSLDFGEFAYQGVEENATDIMLRIGSIYTLALRNLSEPAQYVEIETQFNPVWRIGRILKFSNTERKTVIGYITKIENYSDPQNGFVTNLRIRILKYTD